MTKKKVMIIDDDHEFLDELRETLNMSGYETAAFTDGTTALQNVKSVKPDVVLLDLKMDNKSGFQVADEMSRIPEAANISIIAMTGYYTDKEYEFLMNMWGIKNHILKPFNPLDVIAKIEAIL